jgi:hypothetical protein
VEKWTRRDLHRNKPDNTINAYRVSSGVRFSPISPRKTEEPLRDSFKIEISDFPREAATWDMGLKGGFGFMAIIDLFSLASTLTASGIFPGG